MKTPDPLNTDKFWVSRQPSYSRVQALLKEWCRQMDALPKVIDAGYDEVVVTKKDKHGRILATRRRTVPPTVLAHPDASVPDMISAVAASFAEYDPDAGITFLALRPFLTSYNYVKKIAAITDVKRAFEAADKDRGCFLVSKNWAKPKRLMTLAFQSPKMGALQDARDREAELRP